MKYLATDGDKFFKFQHIYGLLNDQMIDMEKTIKAALLRFEVTRDNDQALAEGFYSVIEAIEKVAAAQQILSDRKKASGLAKYIKGLKARFKKFDLGGRAPHA